MDKVPVDANVRASSGKLVGDMTTDHYTDIRELANQIRPEYRTIFIANHVSRVTLIDGRAIGIEVTVGDNNDLFV